MFVSYFRPWKRDVFIKSTFFSSDVFVKKKTDVDEVLIVKKCMFSVCGGLAWMTDGRGPGVGSHLHLHLHLWHFDINMVNYGLAQHHG